MHPKKDEAEFDGYIKRRKYKIVNKRRFYFLVSVCVALITGVAFATIPTKPQMETVVYTVQENKEVFRPESILIASSMLEKESALLVDQTAQANEKVRLEQEAKAKADAEAAAKAKALAEEKARNARIVSVSRGGDSYREVISILEHIVEAEAGDEPYEGKIAIVNVIMNRVNSDMFPNTIRGVVFQKHRFTPATTGRIWKVQVSDESRKAVRDALDGRRAVGENGVKIGTDVYFFLNPDIATDHTIEKSQTFVTRIGGHCFYK